LMCELVIKTAIKNGDYKYNYIVWVGGCDDHYIYYIVLMKTTKNKLLIF